MWRGILHHVRNQHQWLLGDGVSGGECAHGALEEDPTKPYLEPESPPHQRLRNIILDKRFVNNVDYYVNFR